MLIDEKLVTLEQVTEILPDHPHISTIWRWQQKGIQGVRLETVRFGRRIYTSKEALDRFGKARSAQAEEMLTNEMDDGLPRSSRREAEIDQALLRFAGKSKSIQ